MKLNKGIILRYENAIAGGTLYIFDLNKEKIYRSGKREYEWMKNYLFVDDMLEDALPQIVREFRDTLIQLEIIK